MVTSERKVEVTIYNRKGIIQPEQQKEVGGLLAFAVGKGIPDEVKVCFKRGYRLPGMKGVDARITIGKVRNQGKPHPESDETIINRAKGYVDCNWDLFARGSEIAVKMGHQKRHIHIPA